MAFRYFRILRLLIACLVLAGGSTAIRAQEVAPYLSDLKEHRVTDASIAKFLKGIAAERKSSDESLASLGRGETDAGSLGSLMECMAAGNLVDMGKCGGAMAGEKSPQEQASGLEDAVFEGMKQRFWIYFDGTAAERSAQFSAAELAAIERHRQALAAYRKFYLSPHPSEGA